MILSMLKGRPEMQKLRNRRRDAAMIGDTELPLRSHGRVICVRVDQGGLTFWLKGTRSDYRLGWAQAAQSAGINPAIPE